ncbi:MAG: hypothetical protein ACLS7Y_04620 [Thomasclavelia spiroformis]
MAVHYQSYLYEQTTINAIVNRNANVSGKIETQIGWKEAYREEDSEDKTATIIKAKSIFTNH